MDACAVALVLAILFTLVGLFFFWQSDTKRPVETYETVRCLDVDCDIPTYELFEIIQDRFVDPNYHYNLNSHPKRRINKYQPYEGYVKDHIQAWNDLFDKDIIKYDESKLLYGEVAGNEFYLEVEVELEYNNHDYVAHLKLYGDTMQNGDTAIQLTYADFRKD